MGESIGHLVFFFSSRRRHTIFDCDWSSDVCSSDLCEVADRVLPSEQRKQVAPAMATAVGGRKRVVWGKRVDVGWRPIIKKKNSSASPRKTGATIRSNQHFSCPSRGER